MRWKNRYQNDSIEFSITLKKCYKRYFIMFFIAFKKHYQNVSITTLITLKKCYQVSQWYKILWFNNVSTWWWSDYFCIFRDDWASNIDARKSIAAYCVFIGNNLVSWLSKKQFVVARSSMKFGYRALALVAYEVTWLKQLLSELTSCLSHNSIIWCDNVSVGALAMYPVFHAHKKHIEIDVHFVRDQVLKGTLKVRYIPSSYQLADCLTKSLIKRIKFLTAKDFIEILDQFNWKLKNIVHWQ